MGLAIVALHNGARRIYAIDEAARAMGVFPGQPLADALALSPSLKTIEADTEEDEATLGRLADWCSRFSPSVALDLPDGLLLDITGCAHLWDGEAAMAAALMQRLTAQDIPSRIAVAGTIGAAWALARHAPEPIAIAEADETRSRLAVLPVEGLRLDDSVAHQLRRLGLTTIGHVAALPRPALRKRFGESLVRQIARAFGERDEALIFRQQISPWNERRVFAEPIGKPEDISLLLRSLADALCARLERAGLGARWFQAAFHRVDGDIATRAVGTALPARDPKRLADLFAAKLETIDPGFGIETAELTADAVQPLRPAQSDLLISDNQARLSDLAPLVDRLRNRLGHDRVWQVVPYASHLPERSFARVEPLSICSATGWPWVEERYPIRLFRWAEPLEHVIAPLPDEPPRQFEWRGIAHRVRKSEGPHRIAAEWWRRPWTERADDRIRDYYQVEDESGSRFCVFRTGLHDGPRGVKWWLHGLFA